MPRRKPPPERSPGQRPEQERAWLPMDGWYVRRIAGADALKAYRCPGCEQLVPAGTAHVVAWRADSDGSDRRHWHAGCWDASHRRPPPGTPRR